MTNKYINPNDQICNEKWAFVAETDKRYSISTIGRVKCNGFTTMRTGRLRSGKIGTHSMRIKPKYLSPSPDKNGYSVVSLSYPKKPGQTKVYVHRLVALAFLENPLNLPQVAHWDGDGMNAKLSNLRWANQQDNEADKIRHKRNNYSPKGSHTFCDNKVCEFRSRLIEGESLRSIARGEGVAHNTILHAIKNGSAVKYLRKSE